MTFNNFTDEVLAEIDRRKRQILEEIGSLVVAEAQMRTPVLTGDLRRRETHEVISNDTVRVGSDVEYDAYVEFGTSKQQAQPHWTPAYTENLGTIQEIANKNWGEE
ncbi:HK97-gp10 family putative phage morphogenesis protein [Clostridium grantii]|uniref:Phage protein, HK97 gp10 family n=1 Tax=Clostridium grantii DSM 8605 TaxID=1121316 RepID=A0A1M5SE13_9CLOT|nr:HK97-gp10 family putative phage morphogenesis protein [Clostridium grantii]SHH36163.1 phage protein, HK97 gp10 family [Clostridium grantii DSM 8605]